MNFQGFSEVGLLALCLYITIKDLVIPLVKKKSNNKKNGHAKHNNPINIDRLYQEFKDHKEAQNRWNEKMESRLEKFDDRMDQIERRRK
jgi:FtsZ-binding cell division protein ZapB